MLDDRRRIYGNHRNELEMVIFNTRIKNIGIFATLLGACILLAGDPSFIGLIVAWFVVLFGLLLWIVAIANIDIAYCNVAIYDYSPNGPEDYYYEGGFS